MSTLSGIASKGEKGKSKYQCLDINNLYRGESLEPSQQKNTVQRCGKYGMQSLGKVPSARRPPANLPSLKSENSGSEPAVSLVPTGSGGWGNKPGEIQSPTSTQPNVISNSNSVQSTASSHVQGVSVTSANNVLTPQTASLPSSHDQTVTPPIHTTTSDKSWSSIMAGESGAHPPSFLAHQSPLFQQEFPKLSSGDSQNAQIGQKGGSDTQYGPGPSLRPQTEGSWIQGGGRSQTGSLSNISGTQSLVQGPLPHHPSGVEAGGRSSLNSHPPSGVAMGPGIPNSGPAVHGPPLHLPPGTSPQFRTMPSPFMFRGNFSPGPFPPNFPSGIGPRQRFSSGFLPEGRFIGRPIEGEELVTRPIIKEEELNHMDDIARDSSWARPDEIDYNEKIVFSDAEDSSHEEDGHALNDEKKKRTKENKDIIENEKEKNREDKERIRDRVDRERDRDRRPEDRSEKRSCDLNSRNWPIHNYNRYSSNMRSQHSAIRDRETDEEKWKEKRKLQIELIAVVTERATQRKEEEEKRHEETKRAAAKKLQMLDERTGKNQVSDKKEKEDANSTVVPLPNWKNRQSDCDRERSRISNESVDEKTRNESSDFRNVSQVDRQPFLRNERDSRQRSFCDDRTKKDHEEKDKTSLCHRQDRIRMEDRERSSRSIEGPQSYTRHFQNNMPPRFLKQQAERNQFGAVQNNTFMRSSNSPQPSNQSASSNNFDSRWSHSSGSFPGQSAIQGNGNRVQPRRFNSESSESFSEKLRNDCEVEDWDSSQERYKLNRERNYGKHGLHYDSDHIRRFYERREIDSERIVEDNWDRDNCKNRDVLLREKERDRAIEEHLKTDCNNEEGKEWRRVKEHKTEDKDLVELDDIKDNIRKDERKEDVRIERPPRPESRDSKTSRESRNSKDSLREEKHDVDQKIGNNGRAFVSIVDSQLKDEKKKSTDRRDEREKNDQGNQGKYADEYPCPFPNKPRHRFNYPRHIPGPPITREKLEASERNDTKRSLTQLKRFSDGKRTNEEKENVENETKNSQNSKHVSEEKNKTIIADKKENGKQLHELTKQESHDKNVKIDVKEDKEIKIDKQSEEKEKSEKSGKNKGGRGRTESSRGRQGWSVSVYRSSFGNRGERRRKDSGRIAGRNRFANREWTQLSESDISADDLSVSTESGKEEKKPEGAKHNKPRTNFKKNEKENRYKEHIKNEGGENKGNFEIPVVPRFDRKNDYIGNGREGFAPSGQPSRRGRGAIRMRGGISRRMDGYGPPSAKSPFSQQEEKKSRLTEKANDTSKTDDKGNAEEIKGKNKQQTASLAVNSSNPKTITLSSNKIYRMPPRMQKKIEMEPRDTNRSKTSRGRRYHGNKPISDQGDDVWETTSENSEDDRKNESRGNRKNYQKRGAYMRENTNTTNSSSRSARHSTRSNSTGKKYSNRDVHGNKNADIGSLNDKNSSGRNIITSSHSSKTEGNSNKEEIKSIVGNLFNQNSNSDKGRQGEGKDFDDGRNKIKDFKEHCKSERKTTRDKERRNKSTKDSSSQQQQQQQVTASALTTPSGPQPLMSQVVPAPPSVAKSYERKLNLPPRFAKQRRIQKQQSIEMGESNKMNHPANAFPVKEQGTNAPVTNAWEKPLSAVSPGKSTSVQVILNSSEVVQSENSSQRSSPHVSRDTVDKTLLDGSSPPVNTIIFENTNFKSTPNDVMLKNQFNSHIKSPRSEKAERKASEEPEELLGFSGKTDLAAAATVSDREIKNSEQSIIYGKSEDNSDMKLDFQFETELSQLTDDKTTKGMRDLARSIQQSTMSPSTADLNFKIASVKKVWENMHTVSEHSEDANNVNTFSPNFSPDSTMDPSTYSKTVEGAISVAEDGNEVVYNNVTQMQVNVNYTTSKTDVSSTTSNVCKVKPQQQSVLNSGHSPIGHTGQSPLSHSGPISPPPYSTTQAGQFSYQQQAGIGSTAAQFGGMSAIPSPPTVLYNSSTQLPPAYQTFQIDGSQVLSSQAARSQFSQFPPYGLSQGISQTSAFNQQSVYLHQTAPPTAAPDLYQSSLSQYRLQPATGPYGQSQLNNNPNTVLISSTSNSLMSATVKPSTQPIGAIGTKGATPFQQNALPSQHSQLFIPYEPVQLGVNQSYLPNSQLVPRGAPVQPSASSFYSGSAGAQAGFYQTGSTLTQQTPGAPQLHQTTGYSLQGFNSQSSAAAVGIQNFGSQMGAQQYRTAGSVAPTTYLKSSVTHHPTNINLTQKNSVTSQQDVLDSVFSSAPQIPSPKSRPSKQIGQQQPQQSPSQQSNSKFTSYQSVTQSSSQLQPSGTQQRMTQSNINLQNVRSTGSPRYPNPIQRPISYHHNSTRYRTQPCRPASSVKPYFGSQDGNIKLEENSDLKSDDTAEINCDSKLSDSSAQAKLDGSEDDTSKD